MGNRNWKREQYDREVQERKEQDATYKALAGKHNIPREHVIQKLKERSKRIEKNVCNHNEKRL